jgi:threonine dehydrogenase-like Zn-dependent dehydrogenase
MKACAILEPGQAGFREIEDPRPGPGEVLVGMRQMGLCGTDLKSFAGQNPLVSFPRVIGHETACEVLETGPDVPGEIKAGLRTTLYPYTSCGTCSSCRRDRAYACRYNQTMGVQRDGACSPLLTVPHEKLVPTPDLSWDETTLVEPLSVGFHAARRGEISKGHRVVVFGCGMIGLGAIVGSARAGGEVIAVDIDDAKLETARSLGAAHGVNSVTEDLAERVQELTGGDGADVVIEAVGLPQTFRAAVDLACWAGVVVYIGYAKKEVAYDTSLFVAKELDIRGSRNAMPEDFRNVTDLLSTHSVGVEPIITQRYPFSETPAALSFWTENTGVVTKIVIEEF